ncbi:hypothetical protein [Kitasatospora sp. NPDC097691]|uniref:hypothetical protein n=1 Tax=Kitasatospora sp. NPDC097691 TaxID=3157231 RepID=UPI00331D2800
MRDPGASGGYRRASVAPGRLLARSLLVLAGLAVTAVGFRLFLDVHDEMGAHRTAPVCGTAAATPGTDCARHESGRVTARKDDDGYRLTVARETAPTGTYDVDQDFYDDVETGTNVEVTVWRGRVAEIAYHGHRAENPRSSRLPALEVAAVVAVGSALTARGLARSRDADWGAPALGAFVIGYFAFVGGEFLLPAPWPLAVTLGVPLLGWLVLTATAASLA